MPVPDSNASRRRVCAEEALGDLHAEDGAFAVVAFDVAAGRVLAHGQRRAAALRLHARRRARGERGLTATRLFPDAGDAALRLTPLPSGRFVFGHRFVKPIEFTRFWDTAASNRAAAPRATPAPTPRARRRRGRRRRRRASPLGSHRLGWRRRVAVERNREGTRAEGGV